MSYGITLKLFTALHLPGSNGWCVTIYQVLECAILNENDLKGNEKWNKLGVTYKKQNYSQRENNNVNSSTEIVN